MRERRGGGTFGCKLLLLLLSPCGWEGGRGGERGLWAL